MFSFPYIFITSCMLLNLLEEPYKILMLPIYSRSFCLPDSSVFDARIPLFSSQGRRTGGQLRRSLGLYQLSFIYYFIYTLQLSLTLLRQHFPSKRPFTPRPSFELPSNPFFPTFPFRQLISLRAGSGLVLTGPTDDRCSHPSLPRKDGNDRLHHSLV
jgi:hypothetical protein